ncbi:APC family permease [Francisella salimarina]|uniref:APC family permease n=1 Tax=Francisella salimarina TaxID=2599927 RepID=UPI003D816A9F
MKNNLSLLMLTGLIIISVDSVRNLPSLAVFGEYLPLFFIIGVVFFLIPVAFISAELSANFVDEHQNGIFQWCSKGISDNAGMFAIWAQWSSNVIWFPASLLFMSSTICSIFGFASPLAIASIMVTLYLLIMAINHFGVKESAIVSFICMILGVVIPVLVLFIFLGFWLVKGYPLELKVSQISFNLSALKDISALTVVIISFLGIELCSVYVPMLKDPQKTFTRAIFLAVIFIVLMMFLGALTIAFLIPAGSISLYNGLFETFKIGFERLGLPAAMPLISIGLVLGAFGSAISWALSPAVSLRQAAERGYLPKRFSTNNNYGVPSNILYIQGLIVIGLSLTITMVDNMNSFYWVLISLNTEVYLTMYILMFLAALRLRRTSKKTIIHNELVFYSLCIMGILGILVAMIAGFVMPKNLVSIDSLTYAGLYLCGFLFVCSLFMLFVYWRNKHLRDPL